MAGETQPISEAIHDVPCCDYRDHSGDLPACACPEHPRGALHPFGGWPEPTAVDVAGKTS